MDIVGIDIAKAKFDAALLVGARVRHGAFSNTEAGFEQFLAWLERHRPDPATAMHACMEATGNWGLDLAAFLHGRGVRVSVVNPARIKAHGESELARNKTDKLDAALIARFCRAHVPPAWTPRAAHLRELRELVRRCDALKAAPVALRRHHSCGRPGTQVPGHQDGVVRRTRREASFSGGGVIRSGAPSCPAFRMRPPSAAGHGGCALACQAPISVTVGETVFRPSSSWRE